jgi:hypothetical protein
LDPETKLLQQLDRYELEAGEYKFVGRTTFLDYNVPINPKVFTLDLPADVIRVDQTTREVGLAKGRLGDEEVAVEVVRQFLEALIARDYDKAGQLYEGLPATKMKEAFGEIDYLRIVSMGTPTPHPQSDALAVLCEVEIQTGSVKSIKGYTAYVRPVYNQPDRWTISGGI